MNTFIHLQKLVYGLFVCAALLLATQAQAAWTVSPTDPGPLPKKLAFTMTQLTQNIDFVGTDVSSAVFTISKSYPRIDQVTLLSGPAGSSVGPSPEVDGQSIGEFAFGSPGGISDYFELSSAANPLGSASVFIDVDAVNAANGTELVEGNNILTAFADGSVAVDGEVASLPSTLQNGVTYYVYPEPIGCVPSAEVCDGLDNDCDGEVDEDIAPVPTSCGVGECGAAGAISCVAGNLVDSCTPGTPSAEQCDGLDNDCDGTADEDIAPVPTSCGVGECGATGAISCVAGNLVDSCTPGTPSAEQCDGLDNDCNGEVDNVDEDNDAVNDCSADLCVGSVLPDNSPTKKLNPNHYACTDTDGTFNVGLPGGGVVESGENGTTAYTLADTFGCTCDQILESTGGSNGQLKHGCSPGTITDWIEQNN